VRVAQAMNFPQAISPSRIYAVYLDIVKPLQKNGISLTECCRIPTRGWFVDGLLMKRLKREAVDSICGG